MFFNNPIKASEIQEEYNLYLQSWDENIILAKKYMNDAESYLKEGDILTSCSSQRKASTYGVIATESLIKAQNLIPNESNDIRGLEEGLKKWKALDDFCN